MIVLRGDMPPLHQLERAPPEVVEILGVGNGGQAAVIAPWPEAKAGNEREIHCKDAAVTNAVIAVDAFDAHDFLPSIARLPFVSPGTEIRDTGLNRLVLEIDITLTHTKIRTGGIIVWE